MMWPMASSKSDFSASGPVAGAEWRLPPGGGPRRPPPFRPAPVRPHPPPLGQLGGSGLVRTETVAQERERAHEVPLVTALGGKTGEGGAQGLAGSALVVGGHVVDGCHGRTPGLTSADLVGVGSVGFAALGPSGRGARSGHGG